MQPGNRHIPSPLNKRQDGSNRSFSQSQQSKDMYQQIDSSFGTNICFLKQTAKHGYLKTEGNSVEEQIFEHDMSGSDADQNEISMSSEYVDMEKLDDEKLAELLLDDDIQDEVEDLDQPLLLVSTEDINSKQIVLKKKPLALNMKKMKILQADCQDSIDINKL